MSSAQTKVLTVIDGETGTILNPATVYAVMTNDETMDAIDGCDSAAIDLAKSDGVLIPVEAIATRNIADLVQSPAFPEVMTVPVLSTAHLTLSDSELLTQFARWDYSKELRKGKGVTVIEEPDFGYWVFVPSDLSGDARDEEINALLEEGLSDSSVAIIVAASDAGHRWVRFDRDGECSDAFPTFDW